MRNTRHTFTAWVAVLAVLLHALIPFAQAANASHSVVTAFCSVHGGKTISMSIPATPAEGQGHHSALLAKCPLCLAGAHFALPTHPSLALFSAALLTHVHVPASGAAPTGGDTWRHGAPRGPPLA